MRTALFAALLLATPAAAEVQPTLQQQVEAKLAEAGPGVRFGLVVATLDGKEMLAINPDGRFVPASNTKLFTTIAAFELLPGLDQPDRDGGALVSLRPRKGGGVDVVLEGRGDARLSSAPTCQTDCLSTLADAVARETRKVGDVVGLARPFTDERWSFGMSWNNIPTRSGTAIAALSVDDNELALRLKGDVPDAIPDVSGDNYFTVENFTRTLADEPAAIEAVRLPGSRTIRLTGSVPVGGEGHQLRLGVDDPAEFAAWRFRQMLQARGVRVTGTVRSDYRASAGLPEGRELARLTPPPLGHDIVTINKVSQNLHAELLLRRLGLAAENPSVAGGLEAVRAMLNRAGVPERAVTLADGSGMSPYNRVSPRGVVTMLRWAAGRPWGPALRASLPIGGVDGTLRNRFKDGGLKGRIFAKTGSLTAASALSGYLLTKGGETLVFSVLASDVPEEVRATAIMDGALELVAASR